MYLLIFCEVSSIVDITDILILQDTVGSFCLGVCLAGPCALNAHWQLESRSYTPGACLVL